MKVVYVETEEFQTLIKKKRVVVKKREFALF